MIKRLLSSMISNSDRLPMKGGPQSKVIVHSELGRIFIEGLANKIKFRSQEIFIIDQQRNGEREQARKQRT